MGAWGVVFVLIVCGYLSDLLDGPIARRYHAESEYGKETDLTVDIVFDESLVIGLLVADQIDWSWAIVIALIIIAIRLPGFLDQIWVRWVGTALLPFWAIGMLWIVTVYAVNAFGVEGLQTIAMFSIPVAIIVAVLKRERIAKDVKTAFQDAKTIWEKFRE